MTKFRVGQRIIGNERAMGQYSITTVGWRGFVIAIHRGNLISVSRCSGSDDGYSVDANCFDLASTEAEERNEDMSTNSNIVYRYADGTEKGIYCHWDGYLDYNGRMLLEHYDTPSRVKELIELGDISSLRQNINPDPDLPHDFDNPQENVTVAYHRDRGDALRFSGKSENYECGLFGIEYVYVFDERTKEWWVTYRHNDAKTTDRLYQTILQIDIERSRID